MDGIPLGTSYTWSEARAQGVTRSQIRSDGIPLARGLYLSSSAEPDLGIRCAAWATMLPPDAAFAMDTAVVLHGAAQATTGIHVAMRPRRVLPQHRGITAHARRLTDEDIVERDGLRMTSGAQTFLDMAPRLLPWDLVALGDALMRAGVLTRGDLMRRLARADRVRGVVAARASGLRPVGSGGRPRRSRLRGVEDRPSSTKGDSMPSVISSGATSTGIHSWRPTAGWCSASPPGTSAVPWCRSTGLAGLSSAADGGQARVDHRVRARDTAGHAAGSSTQTMINLGHVGS
ncbi:MAG: hypothetical protein ACXVXT_20015 [Blastococcus sp.]